MLYIQTVLRNDVGVALNKKITVADILLLQGAVIVYSLSTVAANLASKQEFLSLSYIVFFALEFLILAAYAIMWQQIIKKFQLSVAYANKPLTLMWSLLWNFIIFHQGITPWKVVGVVFVIAGIIVMNSGAVSDSSDKEDNDD